MRHIVYISRYACMGKRTWHRKISIRRAHTHVVGLLITAMVFYRRQNLWQLNFVTYIVINIFCILSAFKMCPQYLS
jgi:hypothetical protein